MSPYVWNWKGADTMQHHMLKVLSTCTCINSFFHMYISVSYGGWGALGFPIPNSDFPPQTLQLDRILCISFPPQWHQILHLLIIKSVILYEILPAHWVIGGIVLITAQDWRLHTRRSRKPVKESRKNYQRVSNRFCFLRIVIFVCEYMFMFVCVLEWCSPKKI